MGARVVSDSTFVRECAATFASSARATASAVNRGGASPPSAEAPPPPPPPSEWTLATAALGAAIAGSVPASSPHFRVSLVALDAMLASSESTRPEDGAAMSAPLLALATSAAVDDASGGSSHQNGDVLARLFARAALECPRDDVALLAATRALEAARDAIDAGTVEGPSITNAGEMISVTGGHGDGGNGLAEEFADMVHSKEVNLCDGPDDCRPR